MCRTNLALTLALPALLLLSGCGVTRGIAVRSMMPILEKSVAASYRDPDLKTIEQAIPANLVLLRGLCESDPGNAELRRVAVQMYFSYAMGFIEDKDPERAALIYAEGLRLGREGLSRRSWFRKAEAGKPLPDSLALRKLPKKDIPLVFWTVANWSGWIALKLTDPDAIAELPRMTAFLDRVLAVEPDYFLGMPHALMGSILCFRPRMMGGDPELGKKHFDEAFRISGRRMLFFQFAYAKYYCRQTLDEECFDATLKEVLEAPADFNPDYRLLNEVAREKARTLQEKRDELF